MQSDLKAEPVQLQVTDAFKYRILARVCQCEDKASLSNASRTAQHREPRLHIGLPLDEAAPINETLDPELTPQITVDRRERDLWWGGDREVGERTLNRGAADPGNLDGVFGREHHSMPHDARSLCLGTRRRTYRVNRARQRPIER